MTDHDKLMKMLKTKYVISLPSNKPIVPDIDDVLYIENRKMFIKCIHDGSLIPTCKKCVLSYQGISCHGINCNNGVFKEYNG